jgi:cytochrome c5
MLTVRGPTQATPNAYWLVFEAAGIDGGKRTDHLKATFDGGDQSSTTSGSALKRYYVPAACAQCHGGSQETAKLNVLDSDHWHGRVQPGNDFALVHAAGIGVLPDAGNETTSPRFKSVFAELATLNREIRDQIAAAAGEDFQLRAADLWLAGHSTSTEFLSPIARAFPALPSDPHAAVWKNTPEDTTLLLQLDQYCYRCHSSVAYHVFDKKAVLERRNNMIRRIERGPQAIGGMPQDRKLPDGIRDDLVARLRAMQN